LQGSEASAPKFADCGRFLALGVGKFICYSRDEVASSSGQDECGLENSHHEVSSITLQGDPSLSKTLVSLKAIVKAFKEKGEGGRDVAGIGDMGN